MRRIVRETVNPAVWIGVSGIPGVVRITVPIVVGPLQAVVRVVVVEVGPTISVCVSAAEAVLGRVTRYVGALVRFVGRCWVVPLSVVVGVIPLRSVLREGVVLVEHPVTIDVRVYDPVVDALVIPAVRRDDVNPVWMPVDAIDRAAVVAASRAAASSGTRT